LKRINEELGVTLLMVSHDAEAASIAERQLRLEHGKLHEAALAGVTRSLYRNA
jgi:putative ABC transport system ATP-binding protein